MRLDIDPSVDIVFKTILGSEHHKPLLIDFINNILGLKGPSRIRSVSILDPFTLSDLLTGKTSIVDVKAIDQLGRYFQLEIQINSHRALEERMVYSWSGIYYHQLKGGIKYYHLKPVVSIWLLIDNLPPLPKYLPGMELPKGADPIAEATTDLLHTPFGIYSPDAEVFLSQHFGIHVIQLKKIGKRDKIKTNKERWLYFFRHGKQLDPTNLKKDNMDTPIMRQAVDIANEFKEREESFSLYQSRLEERSTRLTIIGSELLEREARIQAFAERDEAISKAAQAIAEKDRAVAEVAAEKDRAVAAEKERFLKLLKAKGIDLDPDSL